MIDSETLGRIAESYPWASWALWDDRFPEEECVEATPEDLLSFFEIHRAALTPDVVFVGLNRSADLDAPFQNFHAPTRQHYDYRLKEFVQDAELGRLWGGYMTDLVDEVEPNADTVTVTDDDADLLLSQLALLDQPAYHVVCFGVKTYQGALEYFGGESEGGPHELQLTTTEVDGLTLHLYRVWFYGAWGANADKVDVLARQLQYLDGKIDS
ncbi:hypothetical protein [Halapricum salinum]|uniref:Uncharacterized protein n=1 Tax=Halapricum salinum TaxID=1457250 RepID=A0A4D6HDL7_9EURY|nr:hypothetical protein [Halapricum salinum]QCC50817.1 hypothetical protein DV733_05970 [Halapricum salinum]